MRLIDAEMLKSALNSGGGESVDINISKSMPLGEIVDTVIQAYRKCLFTEIEKIPTAYDVDKVVGRLEERKKYLLKDFALANKAEEVKERTMARINEIDGLIDIVKSGGIE